MTNKDFINDLNMQIIELQKEIEWYRFYGSFINTYYYKVDAEASEYADIEESNEN